MSVSPDSNGGRISSTPSAWCSAPRPLGTCAVSAYGVRTTPIGSIGKIMLLPRDLRALRGDALPAVPAKHEHVHIPEGQRQRTAPAGTDQMLGKPDDGGVAVDLHDELVERGRVNLLVEFCSKSQLLRLVAAAAIIVGRDEFLGPCILEQRDVLVVKCLVPVLLELNQDLLIGSHALRSGTGRHGREDEGEKAQEAGRGPSHHW